VRFYTNLRDGKGMDTLEALRQAQLGLLDRGRKEKSRLAWPAAWAAFELLGHWK